MVEISTEHRLARTAAFLDAAIVRSRAHGLREYEYSWDRDAMVELPLGESVLSSLKVGNARSIVWTDAFTSDASKLADDFWELAQLCHNPRIRSRLADTAWRLNKKNVKAARNAIDAYIESVQPTGIDQLRQLGPTGLLDGNREPVMPDQEFPVFVSERLMRAREISLALKDTASTRTIEDAVYQRVSEYTTPDDSTRAAWLMRAIAQPPRSAPDWFVSTAIGVLRNLVEHPQQKSGFVETLVRDAKATVRTSDDCDDLVTQLDCIEAEAWVTWADRSEGAQQWAQLHNAHKIAQDRGLGDLRDTLTRRIAAIDATEFLMPIRTEMPISDETTAALQAWQDNLLKEIDNLRDGLARLSAVVVADIQVLAAEQSERGEASLAQFFGTQTVGEGRTYVAEDEESKSRHQLYQEVSIRSTFLATVQLVPALRSLASKFGKSTDVWVAALGHDPIIDELAAHRLADSFDLYFAERFDAAAHIAAPTAERVFRRLAVALGRVVQQPPRPGTDSVPPGLGTILAELQLDLPDEYRRWFQHLLTDPMGHNLRNAIGHGTAGKVDEGRAALLLLASCFVLNLELEVVA